MDVSSSSNLSGMEEHDLTRQLSPYLDRHMVFPLLEYLDTLISKKAISYETKDVAEARLALLMPSTHMVDYAIDVYRSIHGENAIIPTEMEQHKQTVLEKRETLRQACAGLEQLRNDDEQREKLVAAGHWNVAYLCSPSTQLPVAITPDVVEAYRQLARYNYDCGDYISAKNQLSHYIALFSKPPLQPATGALGEDDEELLATTIAATTNAQQQQKHHHHNQDVGNPAMYYLQSIDANMLHVLWGRLACEILAEDWEAASVAVEAVKTAMESMVASKQMDPLQALQQRTWLLHWSLFVYWNDSKKGGLEQLVDLFHSDRYKQAITTNAPHLLRYLTAAVLLCKRRVTKKAAGAGANAEARKLLKNLIYVMQDCEYTDPIVEFVNCLCVKFDFDSAQTKLAECEKVLEADFFLCQQKTLFMEEARVFVFENYCRIHNKIDLKALGEKLAMDEEEAERWIVDLIRNADLDAKIDSNEGCVVMGGSPMSIYEQVVERTRDLNVRSATLAQNLNNMIIEARKEKAKRERMARDEDY